MHILDLQSLLLYYSILLSRPYIVSKMHRWTDSFILPTQKATQCVYWLDRMILQWGKTLTVTLSHLEVKKIILRYFLKIFISNGLLKFECIISRKINSCSLVYKCELLVPYIYQLHFWCPTEKKHFRNHFEQLKGK